MICLECAVVVYECMHVKNSYGTTRLQDLVLQYVPNLCVEVCSYS